jgi:hypothetical protein
MEATKMPVGEQGVDFHATTLQMYQQLMKAQAQACFYHRARGALQADNVRRCQMLAQLAMQTSTDFQNTARCFTVAPLAGLSTLRNLTKQLRYNVGYYDALAHYWEAQHWANQAYKQAVGMGQAVAHMRQSAATFRPLEEFKKLWPAGQTSRHSDTEKLLLQAEEKYKKENSNIYREDVPPVPSPIVGKQYEPTCTIDNELNTPFDGQDIFMRLIPKGLTGLISSYNSKVAELIQNMCRLSHDAAAEQDNILRKFNLPACLHAMSQDVGLPPDLSAKIQDCQDKGPTALDAMSQTMDALASQNQMAIDALDQSVQDEENADAAYRALHGSLWTPLPSAKYNKTWKRKTKDIRDNLHGASTAQQHCHLTYNSNKGLLQMLALDQTALDALVLKSPQAAGAGAKGKAPAADQ